MTRPTTGSANPSAGLPRSTKTSRPPICWCRITGPGCRDPAGALLLQGAPTDVAAIHPFGPVDPVHHLIGPVSGLLQGGTARRDVQHAAAIGAERACVHGGTGVKHHPAGIGRQIVQAPDRAAFLVAT